MLQTVPFYQCNHCHRYKSWILVVLESMRSLHLQRLYRLQLSRNVLALVLFEEIQLGSPHISNFLVNLQMFLASMECMTRIQCCWCTFLFDMALELCLHLGT